MTFDAPTILVIILGVCLAIFLILAIVAVTLFVKILFAARRITAKAEQTTDNVNELLKYTGKKVVPAAASAIATAVVRAAKSRSKRK